MKFAEIVSRYTWQEVEPLYVQLYLKEKRTWKKAKEAFEFIKSLSFTDSNMAIYIEYCDDEEGGYHGVYGKDGSLRPDGQEESYAICLVDWDEWLGMDIDQKTLENYSELEILCHCLWEMTWYGYTIEKIKKFRDDLARLSTSSKKNSYTSDPPW